MSRQFAKFKVEYIDEDDEFRNDYFNTQQEADAFAYNCLRNFLYVQGVYERVDEKTWRVVS